MLENVPTKFPLNCPQCSAPTTIELPPDAEPGTGIERCASGHEFLFRYDGRCVGALQSLST
jgi:hypothetical protein